MAAFHIFIRPQQASADADEAAQPIEGTAGPWLADWTIDGNLAGDAVTLPAAAVQSLTDLTRQFERVFGRTTEDGYGVRPLFPAGVLDDLGRRLLDLAAGDLRPALTARLAESDGQPHQLIITSAQATALGTAAAGRRPWGDWL